MLTIRLRRAGAKRDPHYRVVVVESSTRRDGPFIEIIGHYHPRRQPAEIVLNMERVESYVGQGAQMSDTVRSLYRRVRAGGDAGEVVVEAEAEAVADAKDDAQLEAAAELEADSETDADVEAIAGAGSEEGADSEDGSPAEDASAETDEVDKQD